MSILSKVNKNLTSKEQFFFIKNCGSWIDEEIQLELFCSVLTKITSPTPCMVELGSAGIEGSYYSVLFEKWFDSKCFNICTEVRKDAIEAAIKDWEGLHLLNSKSYHGYNGEWSGWQDGSVKPPDVKRLYVEDLLKENNTKRVDLLHVDIQGSEKSLCEELESYNLYKNIHFLFISVHGGIDNTGVCFSRQDTLNYCKRIIDRNIKVNYIFADPEKGGHGDGLLVVENLEF
jgi:hypothetical protein